MTDNSGRIMSMNRAIADGTRIAIPIPCPGCASGCVELRLIDWTAPDDAGERLPIWADPDGYEGAWGDDYALRGPWDDAWRFPDGERCSDADLAVAFERRCTGTVESRPNRQRRRAAKARGRRQPGGVSLEQTEEILELLEAKGKVRSVIDANGEKLVCRTGSVELREHHVPQPRRRGPAGNFEEDKENHNHD